MSKLASLSLQGFKSIRDLPNLSLGARNVLIGANGTGKTNLISFFRLLSRMTTTPGELQYYVAKAGGASSLLYDGAAVTPELKATLAFETTNGAYEYHVRLKHTGPDHFVFAHENTEFNNLPHVAVWTPLGAGHREARVIELAEGGDVIARQILALLRTCVVYQFHNTSDSARIRQRWDVQDSHALKEDGANLAPFLMRLRDVEPKTYRRIVETVRQMAPFFADFLLEPIGHTVLLQWRERNTDMVFGAHQASDGTLRTLALVALLLQPTKDLPDVLILDEPELGLHPFAINVVTGLLKSVSLHKQVILATQSPTLIDYFDPEDVIVVERSERESTFRRLDPGPLEEWLKEYSLAELWEKNVLGGRPGR